MTTAISRPQTREEPAWSDVLTRVGAWVANFATYGFMTVLALLGIVPVIWMLFSSLKSFGEFNVNQWLWPRTWVWDNYVRVWQGANIGLYFFNSVVMTVTSVTTMIAVGAMAGYALARYRFPMRDSLL